MSKQQDMTPAELTKRILDLEKRCKELERLNKELSRTVKINTTNINKVHKYLKQNVSSLKAKIANLSSTLQTVVHKITKR